MSEKKAKASSSKKKKQFFDPFVRLGAYTAPLPAHGSGQAVPSSFGGEFTDSSLTVLPPLPKSAVLLRVQFRCTVDILPGDAITLHLPGFKGPLPRVFSLDSLPHPDGINCARRFAAYWVGVTKPKRVKGVVGTPPKQTVLLRCLSRIEEHTLVNFAIPFSLGLVTPEKLAASSAKLKIEGNCIIRAEAGRIAKQPFLISTGLKKTAVVDELETYEQVMASVVEDGSLGKDDRFVAEELLLEDVEQLLLAVTTTIVPSSSPAYTQQQQPPCRQRPYPLSMPWSIAPKIFHDYEDAGAFVKVVMENAIAFIKRHDHLAVHKEVAANWGVKVGAVVVLEDLLFMQYGVLYPGLSRTALLAAHLLTMEPVDVARTFPVTELPAYSIQQELISALRTQDTLSAGDSAGATCRAPTRCERILKKWSAVLSVLLTATIPVAGDLGANPSAVIAPNDDGDGDAMEGGRRNRVRFTTPESPEGDEDGLGGEGEVAARASALLKPPPPLFTGLRDLPSEELQCLHTLQEGDWYVFPSITIAQQTCPVPSLTAAASVEQSSILGVADGAAARPAAAADGGEDAHDDGNNNSNDDASTIPDNAVLFEIRRTAEALELADVSLYPLSQQWLLPFSASFRVVSVTTHEELNDLTHIVLDMVGSLVGEVADVEKIPEGDRTIARMVVRKLLVESENSAGKVPAIARLSYLNVRRNERRRLHPPTLMRTQYLGHFHELKRASEAKRTVEDGTVQWQVRVHPAQSLEEGVVKPALWEPLPKKFAPAVELFFLGRTRTKFLLEDNGLTADFAKFVVDYGGKGPRPIRRLVAKRITHEPGLEDGVVTYNETKERTLSATAQLAALNVKLGLAPDGQPLAAPQAAAASTGKGKKATGGSGAKSAAAVKAA